jgi:hypothetical protein
LVENGDSNKLQSLQVVLGPERMQPIKGAWLNSLIKRDLDQSFTFKPIIGTMRNKKVVMENLLTPDEIRDFGELVKLGDRFGQPILSTSGTGASNLFKDITEGVKSGIANDAFIETAKRRARDRGISAPATPVGAAAAIQGQGGKLQNLQLPPRNALERALKGSQVISSQDEERKAQQNAFQRKLEQMKR